MWRVALLCGATLVACSIDTGGLATVERTDGGPADTGTSPPDGEPPDGVIPIAPVPVRLAVSGPRNAHPALAWTETELVVAYVVAADATGGHVELRRAPAGGTLGEPERLATDVQPRSSLSLAHSADGLAVGWVDGTGTSGTLRAQTMPPGPYGAFDGVEVHNDFDDALVVWNGPRLTGIARKQSAPDETIVWARFQTGAAEMGTIGPPLDDYGELASAATSAGPLLVTGKVGRVYGPSGQPDLSWRIVHAFDIPGMLEGDLAEISDGSLLAVFTASTGASRNLVSQRLIDEGDGTWSEEPLRSLAWLGADPAVAAVEQGVFVAWTDETDGPTSRPLGLLLLDSSGAMRGERCTVEPELPFANDPDVACAEDFCAVVWMEADGLDSDGFVTRFLQLAVRDGVFDCP